MMSKAVWIESSAWYSAKSFYIAQIYSGILVVIFFLFLMLGLNKPVIRGPVMWLQMSGRLELMSLSYEGFFNEIRFHESIGSYSDGDHNKWFMIIQWL